MMPKVHPIGDEDLLITLQEDFERTMRLLGVGTDSEGQPLPDSDKKQAYRKKLFGQNVIEDAPWMYWDTMMMLDSKIPIHEWDALSVRHRARIKAALRLRSMASIIDRHRDLQDESQKKSGFGGQL